MTTRSDYVQTAATPAVAEYCALRETCGMSTRSHEAAAAGLPNGLYSTVIRLDGQLIAMGRVIGDGGCNYEIVDVAVEPAHQRLGLGRQVMQALMDYLDREAPATAYVSMIADGPAPALYKQFGFEATAPVSIGMGLRMPRRKAAPESQPV